MNVFKLVGSFLINGVDEANAKIKATTTEAKAGFGEAEAAAERSSGKISAGLGKLGSALGTAAKVGVAALAATSTIAVGALGVVAKGALEAYASYEQLTGGVETLFKDSAPIVERYAANAYQTAGMSANDYMETVTGFSASLLQSLGGDTAAAAEKANVAVTDMSDNANKMGTSIGSIQDAYQGFAKQNYTMLDNLKLGYGGTQEEMQRLLSDAEKLSGVHYDLSSYSDIVDAIHVVQTEMGITGTTALEASTTIEGSVNTAKAAWTNWMTDLGREDSDMVESTYDLVNAIGTAAGNIVPRLVQILTTLGTTLSEFLPEIIGQLVEGLGTHGPPLLDAASLLFSMIVQALIDNGPAVLTYLLELLSNTVQYLTDNLPAMLDGAAAFFGGIMTALGENGPQILEGLLGLLTQLVQYLVDNMPAIVDGAFTLFGGILMALGQAAPQIVGQLFLLLASLVAAIAGKVGEMISGGMEMIGGLVEGFGLVDVLGAIGGIVDTVLGAFAGAGTWLLDAGWNILQGLWDGIFGGLDWLGGQLAGIGDFIVEHKGPPAKDKVMLNGNGSLIMGGLVDGIVGGMPALRAALSDVSGEISGCSMTANLSRNVSTNASSAATEAGALDPSFMASLKQTIVSAITDGLASGKITAVSYLDGDVLVSKTDKRMERAIVKRNELSGGIA